MRPGSWLLVVGVGLAGCRGPTGPEREISGSRLYSQHCARCHGEDGKGVEDQPQARDLSDARLMGNYSSSHLMRVIQMGKPPLMPGFGEQFTEASLNVLVAHVRSLSSDAP